jgi:hypothetical protein
MRRERSLVGGLSERSDASHRVKVAVPRDLFAEILRMFAELRPPPLASTA